jgi:NADPH:quinone reductase-like Zn-dependent oxidoreductase
MTNHHIVIMAQGDAQIAEVPVPQLKDDYILVTTRAVALNPTDWKHVDFMASPGARLGCDYAGIVEAVGKAVTKGFKKGDGVAGPCYGANAANHDTGTFGQHITVKGDLQIKIPDNLSFEEAATLGIGLTTASQALYQNLRLPLPDSKAKAGCPILIFGGSTATGALSIQLAKLSGAFVITTCSPRNFEYVKATGADVVLDYNSPTIVEDIKGAANNDLKYALDCISLESSVRICAGAIRESGGQLALLQPAPDELVHSINKNVSSRMTIAYTVLGESIKVGPHEVPAQAEDLEFGKTFWELARSLLEQRKLKVHTPKVNPTGSGLEGMLEGLQRMRQGEISGNKWVYTIS